MLGAGAVEYYYMMGGEKHSKHSPHGSCLEAETAACYRQKPPLEQQSAFSHSAAPRPCLAIPSAQTIGEKNEKHNGGRNISESKH